MKLLHAFDTALALVLYLVFATCCTAATSDKWPLNLQLIPKASGMQGLASVYAVGLAVDGVGPVTLLVDTGSPALVVQGDSPARDTANFLGTDAAVATIHYGGSTVSGQISRSKTCFKASKDSDVCVADFPVFKVTQGDAGFSQLGLDGVLGLAPVPGEKSLGLKGVDKTLLDGISSAGGPRVFGLFVSPAEFFGPSELSLGGYDVTKIRPGAEIQYMPLATPSTGRWELALKAVRFAPADGGAMETVDVCEGRSDCRVLLDSGTAQLATTATLSNSLGMHTTSESGGCFALDAMPDMHIEFSGGATVVLQPQDYVADQAMCSLAAEEMTSAELEKNKKWAMILGQPFFKRVYAIFDQDQGRIGLAPSIASEKQTGNEERRQQDKQEKNDNMMKWLR